MKENKEGQTKKSLTINLPEESWERLSAMANGQQRSLEGLVEEAVQAYLGKQEPQLQDPKVDPIENTAPAKSWGYNSDVKGK